MMDGLIDKIYEAAFVPDLWPDALSGMTELSKSFGAGLLVFAGDSAPQGVSTDTLRELMGEFLSDAALQNSASCINMCRRDQPVGFVDIDAILSASEIEDDPFRERVRASGIGSQLCAAISMPTGELAVFIHQRKIADGAYERCVMDALNALRPHLSRASLMSARMRSERAQNFVSAMSTIGLPAAVLSLDGRVRATNSSLEQMESLFLAQAFGGLGLADRRANKMLQSAIAHWCSDRKVTGLSIPLSATENSPPMVVHLLPLLRSAHEIFNGGDLLMVATPAVASSLVPSLTILAGLFDLTPSESKTAAGLAAGASLKQIASNHGIEISTVRSYLEKIFQKTGTHRQSELVALLKSIQPVSLPMNAEE